MRSLLLAALVAAVAVPASAQIVEREIVVEDDNADGRDREARVMRWVVRGDTTLGDAERIEIRLDSLGARLGGLLGPAGPLGTRMRRFEIEVDGDAPSVRFQTDDDGTDPELRARLARLDADARRLAREVRHGDPSAERALDGVLAELFELRGDLRRQRAAALRLRADALRDQADEIDREADRRASDRDRVIEARKRQLLDDGAASDW